MLTADEVRHRLRQDLVTIADDYQVNIENRLYTETEYVELMQTLLRLRELNMPADGLAQMLAIN